MKTQTYRMKDACTRTGLTERTIRFYIEKGLLTPQQEEMNGRTLTFFEEEDLARLEEVSLLRKAGFSIDSIVTMTKYPQTIGDIVNEQLEKITREAKDNRAVSELLQNAARENCSSVHELFTALNREPMHSIPVPHTDSEPDFSKFEDATEQERLDGIVDYVVSQRKRDKAGIHRKKLWRIVLVLLCVILVFGTITAISFTPHHIDKTVECYQYHGSEPQLDCMVQVTLKGALYTPTIVSPYFVGEITIEQQGDDIPTEAQFPTDWGQPLHTTDKLTFSVTNNYSETLFCTDVEGNEHLLGVFYLQNRDFDRFEIWLYTPFSDQNGRSSGENGYIIGTDTITDAHDTLLEKLI